MTYDNEDGIKKALGIESWRNLSKDKILQLLAMWPDVDKDIAQVILGQVPELASMSKTAMGDIEATFGATLEASTHSAKNLAEAVAHEMETIRLALLKDPANETLWARYRELIDLMAANDSEVRQFAGALYQTKVAEKIAVMAIVAGALFAGLKSGSQAGGGISRIISTVRHAA